MNQLTSDEIRETFLKFFQEKGHQIVPSAPIVVKNDPTLMFTNAGMNQFKDLFLGNSAIEYNRVADTQKCLRVSGKHNDLEEVGVDTYHHTMFEMLGNWSFGDPKMPAVGYFKKEAIQWSWELLHDRFGIPMDRIYATIFEGDIQQQIPMDQEAYDEWLKYLPKERILLGSKKDNFWEMGDTGPCGPCTEIHVDCRSEEERIASDGAELVNNDHPQVIEIWNNVFIQFNRIKDGSLHALPAKHVDTGMGFERLVRVLQHKQSNYDTDLFSPTIHKIEEITGMSYGRTMTKPDIAFRVLADHIRAICFTIADGQLPSNTGAGYVIRRILRRAIRYYFSFLNCKEPLMTQLVPVLAIQFKNVFPELYQQMDFVQRAIQEEELSFLKTLDSGIKRFDQIVEESGPQLAGDKVFELMDTFGFPVDLSVLMAQEKGKEVDLSGFDEALQKQKIRSRASTHVENDDWAAVNDGEVTFVGYDDLEVETVVLKYRTYRQKDQTGYQIVLKETPFYAESGGQVGDSGVLIFGNENIKVINTRKENDLIIHTISQIPSNPHHPVKAIVDKNRRHLIALNHTATHLMHSALRKVLGKHVTQKGSLVNENHLRFDFSHFAKLTDEEIRAVEQLVQEKIRENIPVVIKTMPRDEAMESGAMALFGEKYGKTVRVVIIDPNYSVELCGGTHLGATGELGLFKIDSESAVAAGVRRVEALTGHLAVAYMDNFQNNIKDLRKLLQNPKDILAKVEEMAIENRSLIKELELFALEKVNHLQKELFNSSQLIHNIKVISARTQIDDGKLLKNLGFNLIREMGSGVVVLGNEAKGKATVQINISEDLIMSKGLNAGEMIKIAAPRINGGGGGQVGYATAGGDNISGLDEALALVNQGLK